MDIFRTRHGNLQKFTYRNIHQNAKSRLDRGYITKKLFDKIYEDDMKVFINSDHDVYYFKLKVKNQGFKATHKKEQRDNIWKYNEEILKDEDVFKRFKEMWDKWLERKKEYINQSTFWTHSKNKIVAFLKKEGKERKNQRKDRHENLMKELKVERRKKIRKHLIAQDSKKLKEN